MKRSALLALPFVLATAQASEDVPYITSSDNVTRSMLQIARVSKRDYVIDLGSGDGRIVIEAAKLGARGLGVEIVPELVKKSRENAKAAGVEDRAEFAEQDLFKTDLTKATVVTMYLLPAVNLQLRPHLLELKPGTRIVSHDWDMGDWEPDRTLTVPVPDKKVGIDKTSKVMLWTVPPKVAGAWCGAKAAAGATIEIEQRYQKVELKVTQADKAGTFAGSAGDRGIVPPHGHPPWRIRLDSTKRLLVMSPPGDFTSLAGAYFERRAGAACPNP